MLYHVSQWKRPTLKYSKKPKQDPNPPGIIDKYLEFDDGKNCSGYVAYRWPSKVIRKYFFNFNAATKIVKLSVAVQIANSTVWQRKSTVNLIVEREIYLLLKREDALSEREIERIFARFD